MQKLLGMLLSLVVLALFAALIVLRPFFYDLIHMPADTMAPTAVADSYVLADKYGFGIASLANATWRYGEPKRRAERGELVIFTQGGAALLGRVLAVPGDKLQYYDDGSLKLNGVPVAQTKVDSAAAAQAGYEWREEQLDGRRWQIRLRSDAAGSRTSGHRDVVGDTYCVLADSRDEGSDSRVFGLVPRADVLAVVVRTSDVAGSWWPNKAVSSQAH